MIQEVILSPHGVSIPLWNTLTHIFLKWNEDETFDEFLKRNLLHYVEGSTIFSVYSIYNMKKELIMEFYVYEIKGDYFLISLKKIEDLDSIFGSICVRYNYLNVLKFISEYGLPFSNSYVEVC